MFKVQLPLDFVTCLCVFYLTKRLRVPACKKGRKFDFAYIFMVDRLGRDKNYWIVFFWQNILCFKEICKLPNSV